MKKKILSRIWLINYFKESHLIWNLKICIFIITSTYITYFNQYYITDTIAQSYQQYFRKDYSYTEHLLLFSPKTNLSIPPSSNFEVTTLITKTANHLARYTRTLENSTISALQIKSQLGKAER